MVLRCGKREAMEGVLMVCGWLNSQWRGRALTVVDEHRDAQIDRKENFL